MRCRDWAVVIQPGWRVSEILGNQIIASPARLLSTTGRCNRDIDPTWTTTFVFPQHCQVFPFNWQTPIRERSSLIVVWLWHGVSSMGNTSRTEAVVVEVVARTLSVVDGDVAH